MAVIVGLGSARPSYACDCNADTYRVLPPERLPDGSRFLAPTNTKVWIIENALISMPQRRFIVVKHGLHNLNEPIAQAWSDSSHLRAATDCRIHYEYRLTVMSGSFVAQQQYDVVRDPDQKAEVIATFWTGSQPDLTPPAVEGALSCLAEDGNKPAEATCDWFLPAINVGIKAHDDNTPDMLLLYRMQSSDSKGSSTTESVSTVLAVEPNHVRLTTGNVCEGATIRLPEPFEPGRLNVSVVDLAGNQSQVRTCAFVGPQTYEVRKALEKSRGCPAPQPVRPLVPQAWPKAAAEEGKDKLTRFWIICLSVVSTLLSVACLLLVKRLRQVRGDSRNQRI